MKRYWRLFFTFARFSLMNQLAYPPSFFLAVLGKTLRVGILIVFFQAIYLHTPTLAGWSFDDILVLTAAFLTIEFLIVITFHRNLAYFLPNYLRIGTFDLMLAKPVNTLWYTAFRVVDLMDAVSAIPVLLVWGVAVARGAVQLSVANILFFLVLVAVSYLFFFAMTIIISAVNFRTLAPTGVGRLYENIARIGRYPASVFGGGARLFLLFVFPVVTAVSVPAEILRGSIPWGLTLYFIVFTALLFLIALWSWRSALIHYSSASS